MPHLFTNSLFYFCKKSVIMGILNYRRRGLYGKKVSYKKKNKIS